MNKKLENIKIARVATVPLFIITQLREQLSAITKAGAELTVITSPDEDNSVPQYIKSCTYRPIVIPRKISLKEDMLALLQLIRLFREERFDIVHSNTPKAGFLCAIAAKIAGVPVRLHTYTGQPWITMTGPKRAITRFCDKLIGWLNTHNYTDSPHQRDFLVAEKIVKNSKATVLGAGSIAGIDLQRFDLKNFSFSMREALKAQYQIDKNDFVLLFVGRITPDKGVFELIQAIPLLKPGLNFKLLVVGPFEDGIEQEIRALAQRLCPDKIIFTGMQSCPENFMAIADLLCLPSYREGFGTVIIEAAAMGLPAVATKIYGLMDAVLDGETGILVPPKNVPLLAEALQKLMTDEALCKRLAANAHQRALKVFDSAIFGDLLVQEYSQHLAEHCGIKTNARQSP